MALIFPSPDSDKACFFSTKTPGEKFFLKFAQEKLSDEWTVFHNLVYGNAQEKNVFGEFDFLLYHEIFGVFAVEVKDGKIEYSESNDWTQNGHAFSRNPWKQAESRESWIRSELSKNFETPIFSFGICCCVCFPDTEFQAGAFPSGCRSRTIFKNDFDGDFAGMIQNFLKNSNVRKKAKDAPLIPTDAVRCVLESLYETAEKFFDNNDNNARELLRLTREQGEILGKSAHGLQRFRVRGGAGTGKTIIACEMAKRLAREKKQVLLLCHNILLAEILKREAEARKLRPYLEARAFDPFARGFIRVKTKDVDAMPEDERNRFFKEDLPVRFAEFLKTHDQKYDAIIVDEAQDFSALRWLAVEEMLKPESKFVIFYDPDQNLFNDELALPKTLENAPEFFLSKNCRNTVRIFEKIRETFPAAPTPMEGSPEGESVEIFSPETDADARTMLEGVLAKLRKRGISAKKITIIGARRDITKTPIGAAKTLGGFPVASIENVGAENPTLPDDAVRYCTCMKFKGCETGTLIVLGLDETNAIDWSPSRIYTTCSRAVSRLFIIHAPKKR